MNASVRGARGPLAPAALLVVLAGLSVCPAGGQETGRAAPRSPADTARPTTVVAGGPSGHATVQAALDAAGPWDTVLVRPGVYRERPVLRSPVVLRGEPGAILDGGGRGVVLTVTAPARVSGLAIRASGRDLSREDAGVMVLEADDVVIESLELEDVLFGIYLKQSARPVIRNNRVVGKPLPMGERGDGIRLWYCRGGEVVGNALRQTRDLVIWFSSDLLVRDNEVRDSRYGVHYMYSDHNRFEDNRFVNDHVGAFIMYSSDIEFRGNLFLDAFGASGVGLGLKDADDIRAVGNAFVGNAAGVTLDNSPTSVGVTNTFRDNLVAYNAVGVSLLPSVSSNEFAGNSFVENVTPVAVSGGGDALDNAWRHNYWSAYAGFDEDGDGVGDTPYRHERVADALFARHPELRWLVMSPAAGALDLLGRLFPLLEPRPVVIDSAPALSMPAGGLEAYALDAGPGGRSGSGAEPVAAGVLFAAGALAFGVVVWMGRRRRGVPGGGAAARPAAEAS